MIDRLLILSWSKLCKNKAMILFSLVCSREHGFEGWFKDGAAYESQAALGDIICPVCGDHQIRKAPMAPCVHTGKAVAAVPAEVLREAMVEVRRVIEENCTDVGAAFPTEARRMHYGEIEDRPIYGQATAKDVQELAEEGVEVVALPWMRRQDG